MTDLRHEKGNKIKDNIIRDVRNLFRTEKEIDDTTMKDIGKHFKLKRENESIKGKVIRYIRKDFGLKNYNKNKESSCHKYWDIYNLYEWEIFQKMPVNDFKWVEETSQINKNFIIIYTNSDTAYFINTDIYNPEKLYGLDNQLHFLPERTKIEKDEKLVENVHGKEEYFIHLRNFK